MKIVIVDDDVTLLKTLGFFLEGEGHQVLLADNCHKALIMVEDDTIELVISDIMMPDMTGLDLLNVLKQFYMKSIPVIIMSSLQDAELIMRVQAWGAKMFFAKPLDFKKLSQMISGMTAKTAS